MKCPQTFTRVVKWLKYLPINQEVVDSGSKWGHDYDSYDTSTGCFYAVDPRKICLRFENLFQNRAKVNNV